VWTLWSQVNATPALYRVLTGLGTRLRWLVPQHLGPWTRTRTAPVIAPRSLHELARGEGFPGD
ncbi:MAG: lactate utilization protein LutB domain-containing protein, partial [Chromatiaceae bacterium]